MDREEKISTFGSDTSYDPDAAELLKDLDDDDEEEELSEENDGGMGSPSLARVLSASSESLAGLPTVSEPEGMKELPKLVSVIKPKEEESAPVEEEVSEPVNVASASDSASEEVSAPAEEAAKPAEEAAKPAEEAAKPAVDTKAMLLGDPIRPSTNSIKPFKSSVSEKAVPVPEKPAEKSAEALKAVDAAKPKEEDVPAEASKPMAPPPPPMGGASAPKGRVLREGEQVYTTDQIKDMLAGGKNDEAPDLAALKTADNGWYSQIFNEDYLRTIPKSEPRQTRREARFIIDQLGLEPGARVLDLACGTGRHTIELAKKGYDMVGLDYSMVMLKCALANAQASKQIIKFIHGDMQKLSFKAIFDAVYCVQTSFGYFDDLRNFKVLQGIFRALKPGGVFLIEVTNRDFIVDDLPLRLWWKGKDCKLLEEIDLEHRTGVLKVKRSFVFDDMSRAPWEQNINIRLYTSNELRALLMRAGFNVVELSGDYSHPGAYFGATSPRIIYVAEKPIK